jgi:proteasome lid subunit RPN8/RPN11
VGIGCIEFQLIFENSIPLHAKQIFIGRVPFYPSLYYKDLTVRDHISTCESRMVTHDIQRNADLPSDSLVYPVYVFERTCKEIFNHCLSEASGSSPREALGVILGFRRKWKGNKYIRVTDWATGQIEASIAHARFTPEGIFEYRLALHDRYGNNPHTPRVVGLWHSHPFGGDPHFSSTDLRTFFQTPFCAEGNIFFLIDPLSRIFKVYMLRQRLDKPGLQLERVEWCTYRPFVPRSEAVNLDASAPSEEDETRHDKAHSD